VVKSGIDLPAPKRAPKENLVVIPGPLKPWKHPYMGIKAFAALPDEFRLALFGNYEPPEYEAYLKGLVETLGLSGRVFFLGRISDEQRDELYSKAYLGLVPSEKEDIRGVHHGGEVRQYGEGDDDEGVHI